MLEGHAAPFRFLVSGLTRSADRALRAEFGSLSRSARLWFLVKPPGVVVKVIAPSTRKTYSIVVVSSEWGTRNQKPETRNEVFTAASSTRFARARFPAT